MTERLGILKLPRRAPNWESTKKRIPKWSTLRGLGNSPITKSTVLIPVIGYLIIFNDKVVHYLNLISSLGGAGDSRFGVSPRLLFIYFGLCAVAAAVTLYNSLCPSEVKHYGSANAYVQGDGPAIKDFKFEEIEAALRKDRNAEVDRIRRRYEKSMSDTITEK